MTSIHALSRPAVRPVQSGDWPLVRDVCLMMLRDSPDAFEETVDEVRARSASDWEQLVERCAAGTAVSAFLAEDASGPCGFVRGDRADPRVARGSAYVSHLWVAPHVRRMGLGRKLMEALTDWAQRRGASGLSVAVAGSFPGAREFYESLGFADSGVHHLLPSRPSLEIILMTRSLPASSRNEAAHR